MDFCLAILAALKHSRLVRAGYSVVFLLFSLGAIILSTFQTFISIHARLLFLIQSSFYTNNDCGVLTTVLHIFFSFKSALISHKAKLKSLFSFFKSFPIFKGF